MVKAHNLSVNYISQQTLLKIVQSWQINERPEYRGFRCAYCQRYILKAWHHWLTEGEYITPVHFCNTCEIHLKSSNGEVDKVKKEIDRTRFRLEYPKGIEKELTEIVTTWNTDPKPVYKVFTCDCCQEKLHNAYHVWLTIHRTLVEVHLCKICGSKLGIR